jgi:hypothetical protein
MIVGILLIITGSLISFIPGLKMGKKQSQIENIKEDFENS